MGKANADIAEDLALVKIANKLDIFLGTEYHKHEIEADLNGDKLIEGSFMWTINSGFKCDGGRGLYEEIENCIKVHKRKTATLQTASTPRIPEAAGAFRPLEVCYCERIA